jgi:putative SOS response-associated peptidase YedK
VLSATILTADAEGPLAQIHDRSPVALPEEWWDQWLAPATQGDQALVDAAVAVSRTVMESLNFYEVAPVKGNGPELIEPLNGDSM